MTVVYDEETQEGGRVTMSIVGTTGPTVAHTNRLPMPDEEARRIERAGALAPPYPPHWLAALYEQSTALRPAVEALESMVDGHGHRFEPRFELRAPDSKEKVREAIMYERLMKVGGLRQLAMQGAPIVPTDIDVETRMAEIDVRMRIERMRLEALFSACCPGSDFVILRKMWRRDLEVTGNAYIGVRRDNSGDVAEFEYLPSVSMRLRPTVTDPHGAPLWVPVDIPVRKTPITIDHVTTHLKFRTFVQFGLTTNVYFKELGDPRIFSSRSGNMVRSEEELRGDPAATEVIHLRIPSSLYEYGVPRWIAASPVVTGLRASQEVNAVHFDSNGIPRMLFLISGGTLKEGADKKLQDILQAHASGRENYGAAVILQATPPANVPNARVQIEAKPLKEAIPDDGLFLNYGARCRDEVLSQFRLPKFIVGLLDDVNRSTAHEGLESVENQVFQPLRGDFDVKMDALLQSEGVMYWKFVSNSPVSRAPETSAKIITGLAQAGGPTINDVRRAMAEITNTPFVPLDQGWADLPYELAKLAFAPPPGGPQSIATTPSAPSAPSVQATAKAAPAPRQVATPKELIDWLVSAREMLERGERNTFSAEFLGPQGRTLVVPMTGDQLAELVDFT